MCKCNQLPLISRLLCTFLCVTLAGVSARADGMSGTTAVEKDLTICNLMADRMLISHDEDPTLPKFGFGKLEDENIQGLKSPIKAMFLSILMPGVGQLYAGANKHHRIFFTTEAAAWLAYGAFKQWGNSKEDEYQGWAAVHAGIDPAGKPDDFWRMMTYYETREEYELYGRAGEPDRTGYPNLVGWDWKWDSEASQSQYRKLRNQSKEADRKAKFSLGALALNRIVAAIDAFRSAKSHNRKKATEMAHTRWRIKGSPFGTHQQVMVIFEGVF